MKTELLDLLSSYDFEPEERFFKVRGHTVPELERLHQILAEHGYIGEPEFECEDGVSSLWISRDSVSWENNRCLLFLNGHDLWSYLLGRDQSPPFFWLISDDFPPDLRERLEFYYCWKRILSCLADHVGTREKPHAYLFFVTNDGAPFKFTINPVLSWKVFLSMNFEQFDLSVIKELEVVIKHNDVHSAERKQVMRSSISDVAKSAGIEFDFVRLVTRTCDFNKQYHERYDLYVHQFSIKRILSEIESKSADYLGKIQESVSSGQAKAYAIPGALIGVAALVDIKGYLEVALVLSGLWIISFITKGANSIHKDSYMLLGRQVDESFRGYEGLLESSRDVRETALARKNELKSMLKRAERRLTTMNRLASFMFWSAAIYVSLGLLTKKTDFLSWLN